jgi:hypothetical protein
MLPRIGVLERLVDKASCTEIGVRNAERDSSEATQIYSRENEDAAVGRTSMRLTNKPLSKDFTEFDQLMRVLLGKNNKRKIAAH